jgi:hypothetical protein
VPDYITDLNFAIDKDSALELHYNYNQVVREVASSNSEWLLLDLEKELSKLDNPSEIFTEDGIHLTPSGSALVAKRITDFIVAKVPLTP